MKAIRVRVVYALPDAATEIELELAEGATVADALEACRMGSRHPELDLARCAVGVYGQRVERAAPLADGDRVEVYRPLFADPKHARRRRAGGRK